MNELPYIQTVERFKQELKRLHSLRDHGKVNSPKRYRLTKKERETIFSKTGGKCHVCGQVIFLNKFEADHVKSHSSGGTSVTDNFLPACRTCNNYRWYYLSEEFQWILKLGIWARTEIEKESGLGDKMANAFIEREKSRENRRKNPRQISI